MKSSSKETLEDTARLLGIEPEELRGGLNLVEASDVLGLSPSGLRSMALRGEITYQRYGRAWRFMWWGLLDFIVVHEHKRVGAQEKLSGKLKESETELRERAREMGLID